MSAQPLGLRERKKLALRDKIHEATMGLIRRHGIENTTIELICEGADIAKKTFYNYYPSRHELLKEICDRRLLQRSQMTVDAAVSESEELHERLTIFFRSFRQLFSLEDGVDRELIDFMVCNFSGNRSEGASQLSFLNKTYTRLFVNESSGLKPGLTAEFCAEITVGMVNTLTLNWLINDQYNIDQNIEWLLEYIVASMLE